VEVTVNGKTSATFPLLDMDDTLLPANEGQTEGNPDDQDGGGNPTDETANNQTAEDAASAVAGYDSDV
jgi:hypothetical protein